MLRTFAIAFLVVCAIWLPGCSGDKALDGSECDVIDCSYNTIVCQRYEQTATDPRTLVIHYRRTFDGGFEWAARLAIQFPGQSPIQGALLEGQTFLDQVEISSPASDGAQWPPAKSGMCNIDSGGDEVGKKLSGKCSFLFDNGRTLSASFDCTLASPL